MARLALLLLFVGRVSAQLSCTGEEQLVANLRWVREVCEQEGEAFPEGDEDIISCRALSRLLDVRRWCIVSRRAAAGCSRAASGLRCARPR